MAGNHVLAGCRFALWVYSGRFGGRCNDVFENWKRHSAGEAVHGVGLRGN